MAHSHQIQQQTSAFKIGVALNTAFIVLEAGYGFASGSLALVADAGHNLSDVLGLLISWLAIWLGQKSANDKYTYGYKSSSILAALFNAVFLLVAIGAISVEAIQRLSNPGPVAEWDVIIVAAVGVVINGFTALLFMKGQKHDLNIKGAFLHMAADAGVFHRRGHCWLHHLEDRLVLARPRCFPANCRRDFDWYLGTLTRCDELFTGSCTEQC